SASRTSPASKASTKSCLRPLRNSSWSSAISARSAIVLHFKSPRPKRATSQFRVTRRYVKCVENIRRSIGKVALRQVLLSRRRRRRYRLNVRRGLAVARQADGVDASAFDLEQLQRAAREIAPVGNLQRHRIDLVAVF